MLNLRPVDGPQEHATLASGTQSAMRPGFALCCWCQVIVRVAVGFRWAGLASLARDSLGLGEAPRRDGGDDGGPVAIARHRCRGGTAWTVRGLV